MKTTSKILLVVTFLVTLIALAIQYMQIPYSKLALPNALFGLWILIPLICAVLLMSVTRTSSLYILLSVATPFPTVVLIRIIYDTLGRSDSHNLWPFEILIATVLGVVIAGIGIAVGSIIQKLMKLKR